MKLLKKKNKDTVAKNTNSQNINNQQPQYQQVQTMSEEDRLFQSMYGNLLTSEEEKQEEKKKRPKKLKENGKKIKKKKETDTEKTVAKIIPIKDIYNGAFVYKDNSLMDMYQVTCKDLIASSEDEVMNDIFNLQKFNKLYGDDYKILGINFATDTKSQQVFYQHLLSNPNTPTNLKEILVEKLNELIEIEKTRTDREYYIMIFGKDPENLNSNRGIIQSALGESGLLKKMTMEKKIHILYKIANKSSSALFKNKEEIEYITSHEAEEQYKMLGYNPYLLNQIQPQGGITFKYDNFIKTGDGYEKCIRVYGYPSYVDRHWLTYVMNIPDTVTSVDVATYDTMEAKKNLNKGISEYKSREATAKNYAEASDAYSHRSDMEEVYEEIANQGELIKEIICRIYVSAQTREELDARVAKIRQYLEGNEYKSAVFLNENGYEWKAMYDSFRRQNQLPNKRSGFPVSATTLAGADPFHFTSLNDQYGSYYGTTTATGVNGSVIFDPFAFNSKRRSYNGLIVGGMGSGKSTTLKKMIRDRAARGDYIRVIDVTGEFADLGRALGGEVIALDGSSGILNPLQINKASDTESASFSIHLSKLSTIYRFIAPESTQPERLVFEKLARKLYIQAGIIPEDQSKIDNYNVTELNSSAYPTFSDMLNLAIQLEKTEQDVDTKRFYTNIVRVIENLVQNYGKIFDGHTSIDNIIDSQIVIISIKELTAEKEEVFDAQLFSALSLCWANAVKIGSQMKKWVEDKVIPPEYAKHFLLILDESHKTINASKPYAIDQVLVYAREGRKYFAGIYLASQSIRDYVPEGTSSDAAFNKIKTLFEIAQYKFIMNQDTNAVEMLSKIFNGQLTNTEISNIPRLQRGQVILVISGDTNIMFDVEVTKEELALFKGGI